MSAPYLGDIAEDATIRFLWSTNDGAGASITRATDGTISVYKDNGLTQSTAGVTDTEDFDSLTGIHACTIDTSADAFYATGSDYTVVLSAATIDGETVNAVLAHFSIENRFADVNVAQISGSADAADVLELLYTGAIVSGSVDDVSPSATSFATDLTEATDDHFNGGFLVFIENALSGQGRKISDYNGTTKAVVTSAYTEAPANGDRFIILGRSE